MRSGKILTFTWESIYNTGVRLAETETGKEPQMEELKWMRVGRGRKADKGHTAVKYAEQYDRHRMATRTFVECQCGKVYSGWDQGGHYGYVRHLMEELKKVEG